MFCTCLCMPLPICRLHCPLIHCQAAAYARGTAGCARKRVATISYLRWIQQSTSQVSEWKVPCNSHLSILILQTQTISASVEVLFSSRLHIKENLLIHALLLRGFPEPSHARHIAEPILCGQAFLGQHAAPGAHEL